MIYGPQIGSFHQLQARRPLMQRLPHPNGEIQQRKIIVIKQQDMRAGYTHKYIYISTSSIIQMDIKEIEVNIS